MKTFLLKGKYAVTSLVILMFTIELTAQTSGVNNFEYRGSARVNISTNIVAAMYNINSKVYNGNPEEIARQFLGEHKSNFGIADMSDLLKARLVIMLAFYKPIMEFQFLVPKR